MSLATLGPIGRIPGAPGTFASIAATLAAPFVFLPLPLALRLIVLATVFVAGGLAATRAEEALGRKDPGCVVVDELAGQWLTFLPFAALAPVDLAVGLALFRLFDVLKPPPVKASEDWMPGGFGVMLDDVLAGVYACACLALWRAVWG